MRTPSILLRLLLILSLILNGLSGAVAGVVLAEAPAQTMHQPSTAGDETGDCGAGHEGTTDEAPSGSCCHSPDAAGCSDGLQCLQACAQAGLAIGQPFAIGVQVNATRPLHPCAMGHPSPPARSPIRPPIA